MRQAVPLRLRVLHLRRVNAREQRERYEAEKGRQALERQIVAKARSAGCKCDEGLILANRLAGAHAGHGPHCPLGLARGFGAQA